MMVVVWFLGFYVSGHWLSLVLSSLLTALETEHLTLESHTSALHRLSLTLSHLTDKSNSLTHEKSLLKTELEVVKAEKERQERSLDGMRVRDKGELERLEDLLGWRVVGVRGE